MIDSDNYVTKKSANSHQIITKTPEEYMMKKVLVEKNNKFFTYNFPSKKTTSLILRGLYSTFSATAIVEELKTQRTSSVITVKLFVMTWTKTMNTWSHIHDGHI